MPLQRFPISTNYIPFHRPPLTTGPPQHCDAIHVFPSWFYLPITCSLQQHRCKTLHANAVNTKGCNYTWSWTRPPFLSPITYSSTVHIKALLPSPSLSPKWTFSKWFPPPFCVLSVSTSPLSYFDVRPVRTKNYDLYKSRRSSLSNTLHLMYDCPCVVV